MVPGDSSSYRRVFSQRRWSSWRLARQLTTWVVQHLLPDGPIRLAGDDTVDEHRGANVYGKGCHRDPVRSTHSYTAFRWGHKWVVLAILVQFPFAPRLGVAGAGGVVSQPGEGHEIEDPGRKAPAQEAGQGQDQGPGQGAGRTQGSSPAPGQDQAPEEDQGAAAAAAQDACGADAATAVGPDPLVPRAALRLR